MRICSEAGCLRTVPDDVRFCDECASKHTHKEDRAANDAIMAQYRTARWQKFRLQVLRLHPFCARCPRPATVADHNVPARLIVRVAREGRWFPFDMWGGFYLLDNMVGLCGACNRAKAKTEDAEDWTYEIHLLTIKYTRNKGEDS